MIKQCENFEELFKEIKKTFNIDDIYDNKIEIKTDDETDIKDQDDFEELISDEYPPLIVNIPNYSNTISNLSKNNNNISSMTKDKGEEVMEKISNYISNYQEIIINQTAVKSQNHFDLESNVKLAENTLPGSIISLMKKEGHPLSISFIREKIKDRFLSFRKANGAKYKKDINIVLKSTLNTSGIFYKTGIDTYYFKNPWFE